MKRIFKASLTSFNTNECPHGSSEITLLSHVKANTSTCSDANIPNTSINMSCGDFSDQTKTSCRSLTGNASVIINIKFEGFPDKRVIGYFYKAEYKGKN
ncbi:hypothetical protein ElyMa_006213700 [Elysia marginata]|uniref:CUB domain-containing protein n=1 Tax=Elysia marginata TaxID=1093978 RepID=A0AAV4H5D0_9GAST|nr:hypothetical protein ElyMa_006213700 [Elysia marginata]